MANLPAVSPVKNIVPSSDLDDPADYLPNPSSSPQYRSGHSEYSPSIQDYTPKDINIELLQESTDILIPRIEDVRIQVANLLMTVKGTADFEPNFGSWVPVRVFDQLTGPYFSRDIQTDIYTAIKRYMPSVINTATLSVMVLPIEGNNGVSVHISYNLVNTNESDAFSLTLGTRKGNN